MNEQRREAVRAVAEAAVMGGRDLPETIAYAVEAALSWPDVEAPRPLRAAARGTRPDASLWGDVAADLLIQGIALVQAARRAHTSDNPWTRQAEGWLGRAENFTDTGAVRLYPERAPEPLEPVHVHPKARWTCGCSQAACDIRWQRTYVVEEYGTPPLERLEARCVTHDLVGMSRAFTTEEVADLAAGRTGTQRAQALTELNTAHQEQCR